MIDQSAEDIPPHDVGTDPYTASQPQQMPVREKPTVNGLMLDRMDDIRVEQINLDNSITAQGALLSDLRVELTHIMTGFNGTIKVMLALAIASLALGVVTLCAVIFLFGAVR
jgi:hypothetical protein